MGHKLLDLAAALATLATVPADVAKDVVPEINQLILTMGKPGGPLRGGNRVKCRVVAEGNQIRIIGVFSSAGVRRSWVLAIQRAVAAAINNRMRGR